MGTARVTVTADTGPAVQNTSAVFTGVTRFVTDVERQVLTLFQGETPVHEFDLSTVTTYTVTISGGNYTVTVS